MLRYDKAIVIFVKFWYIFYGGIFPKGVDTPAPDNKPEVLL